MMKRSSLLMTLLSFSFIASTAQDATLISVELETYTDDFYGIEVQMVKSVKARGGGFEMSFSEELQSMGWEGTVNGQEASFSAGDGPGTCIYYSQGNEYIFRVWYPGWIVEDPNSGNKFVLRQNIEYPCVDFYDLLLYQVNDDSEGHLAYMWAIYDETGYCDYKSWNINIFEDSLMSKHPDLVAANIMMAALGNMVRETHLRKTVKWGEPTPEMASEYPEIEVKNHEHETEGIPLVDEITLGYDDHVEYIIRNAGDKYELWDVYEQGEKAGFIKLVKVDEPVFIFKLWQDTVVIHEVMYESQWDIRPTDYSRAYELSSDEPDCFTRMVFESQEMPDYPEVYMGIFNQSDQQGCDYENFYTYYPSWYEPLMDHHAEVAALFMSIIQPSKRNMWYYWYPKK